MSRRWQQLLRAYFTLSLISVIILIYLIICRIDDPEQAYVFCGLNFQAIQHWHLWKMFTYAFLHGNHAHIATNAAMILLLGSRLEWILGARKVAEIFFFSVFMGGVFHILLVPGDGLLIGTSGAAMGFLLCFCTLDPYARVIPFRIHAGKLGLGVLCSSFLLSIIHPALKIPLLSNVGEVLIRIAGDSFFSIGHACHLGGSLAGLILAKLHMRLRYSKESLQRERDKNAQ